MNKGLLGFPVGGPRAAPRPTLRDDSIYRMFPGERPPAVPSQWDDEFDDEVLDGKWSWRNQGTSTLIEGAGYELLTPQAGGGAYALRCREQIAPTGDFTLTAKFGGMSQFGGVVNDLGIYVANNGNGRLLSCGCYATSTAGDRVPAVSRWTSVSANSSRPLLGIAGEIAFYYQIIMAGTTMTLRFSPDGLMWKQVGTETIAAFVGSVRGDVDRIGFFSSSYSYANPISVYWFRVTTP